MPDSLQHPDPNSPALDEKAFLCAEPESMLHNSLREPEKQEGPARRCNSNALSIVDFLVHGQIVMDEYLFI